MTDRIYQRIWECLRAGAGPERSPFTMMQLATIGLDGSPTVRTIVLRRASEADNSVSFVTDLRSAKVKELRHSPLISLLGYDPVNNQQIRLEGTAEVLSEGERRAQIWETSRARTLILFQTPLAPGTPIASPAEGHVRQPDAATPGSDGFENFCVVDITLTRLEWLDLAASGHERAAFERNGDQWQGQWIAP